MVNLLKEINFGMKIFYLNYWEILKFMRKCNDGNVLNDISFNVIINFGFSN